MLSLPIANGDELHNALAAPFTAEDLEWKVQTCGKKKGGDGFWALVVPYLSARAIQSRLDEVVGPGGWKNRYEPIMKGPDVAGFLCYLALFIDGQWIEKCDGAELTDIEAVKGGISNALKRCAVQWGLGRYLYSIPTCWATISERGKERAKTKEGDWFNWDPPAIAAPAARAPQPPVDDPISPADHRSAQERHAVAKKIIDDGMAAKSGTATSADQKRIAESFKRAEAATSRDEALEVIAVVGGDGVTKPADVPITKVQALVDALDRLAGLEVGA